MKKQKVNKKEVLLTLLEMQKELKELQKIENKDYNVQKRIFNLKYTIEHVLANYL